LNLADGKNLPEEIPGAKPRDFELSETSGFRTPSEDGRPATASMQKDELMEPISDLEFESSESVSRREFRAVIPGHFVRSGERASRQTAEDQLKRPSSRNRSSRSRRVPDFGVLNPAGRGEKNAKSSTQHLFTRTPHSQFSSQHISRKRFTTLPTFLLYSKYFIDPLSIDQRII